jgi:hypothetical protein
MRLSRSFTLHTLSVDSLFNYPGFFPSNYVKILTEELNQYQHVRVAEIKVQIPEAETGSAPIKPDLPPRTMTPKNLRSKTGAIDVTAAGAPLPASAASASAPVSAANAVTTSIAIQGSVKSDEEKKESKKEEGTRCVWFC